MNMKTLVLAIGATGVISTAAVAQLPSMENTTAQSGEAPAFEQIDVNMDGNITTREAEGTWLADSFAAVDLNKDGLVDAKEYEEAIS